MLAIVTVCLFAMMGLAALAIDLAALRDARGQAQRAADAIALAGASAFRDLPSGDPTAKDVAQARALDIARKNQVWNDTIDITPGSPYVTPNPYPVGKTEYTVKTQDVTLNILPATDSQKVRAWVRRPGVRTFYGKLLGKPFAHVQAMSTAWVRNAGPTPSCLKPFLIPDMWHEANKTQQDVNNNDYMEPAATGNGNNTSGGEQWFYQPAAGDYYAPFDPTVTNPPRPQTGYGTSARGFPGDVGLAMLLKPQTGSNQRQGNSYFTLRGDEANLRDDIKYGCVDASVGDNPDWSQGSATGQARQGITYLINQDPGATWNQSTKQVQGSSYSDWTKSPRVIIVGLMDPIYIQGNSTNVKPDQGAKYNNFARIFLQNTPGNTDNIQGIFLGYAPGGSGGTTNGTLVRVLQLIQ
ncbi:MAG: hypothetical protein H0V92_01095 [Pseudonocardiales bacterium]|nr:hypothetical protein [Pseudonocardiales bacterium]